QLLSFVDGADADVVQTGLRARRRGVDGRAAVFAEGLFANAPAVRRLQVDARRAGQQSKTAERGGYGNSKGRSGQLLTIAAMADIDLIGFDVGLVTDRAAMTSAGDVHAGSPRRLS